VLQVESALSGADILGRPPGRVFNDDTFGAIKTAQGRLNADSRLDLVNSPLKVDGLINPDGPTQGATRKLAGDVLSKRAPITPGPRLPQAQCCRGQAAAVYRGPNHQGLNLPRHDFGICLFRLSPRLPQHLCAGD
jgi:hypothetical protein